ncbi:MAG: hypothetical protein V4474_02730 [Patescibacteria group bacterium]
MTSKIEQQVMASVGVVYTARRLVSASAFKLYATVASAVALWQLVWVHRVFENWSQVGVQGTAQFVWTAVAHAHLPVQLALLVAIFAGVSLARDLMRPAQLPRFAL